MRRIGTGKAVLRLRKARSIGVRESFGVPIGDARRCTAIYWSGNQPSRWLCRRLPFAGNLQATLSLLSGWRDTLFTRRAAWPELRCPGG
jgi:hypothetical protein